ncbi:hypothetical protein LTR36_009586 [Oleoguttula mirabilis]|uniref:diacylglycerol O-acyltransferase n=1 Tax=Oleoguttula mirabilis TaxID=1507867 RepID=A0AAV9J6J8_9PEZI|nr:hypothetical protein LTR36_009586 [Oleoguttula mirabilis]
MIGDARRFTPPSLIPRHRKVLIRPKSGIMSLNFEPADPSERNENGLAPKSYADAAEEALGRNGGVSQIDEDAIKESPPRPNHQRNSSEPRPYGEMLDEEEARSSPGSPSLRHPRGRLENKASRESYAGVVKDNEPAAENSVIYGNGVPLAALNTTANGNGVKHSNGDKTPDTLEGRGEDESPRSPIRKAHKRISSRSLNGTATRQAHAQLQQRSEHDASPKQPPAPINEQTDRPADERTAKPGQLVYENLRNKSGENLASIKPLEDLAGAQREDRPPSPEPPHEEASRPHPSRGDNSTTNSELVSGRHAGAGWSQSAMHWAPLNIPLQRRLQTVVVLLHTLSIVGGLALFFLLCTIPLLWPLLLPYLLYVLLSRAHINGTLSHRSERLRRAKIWSLFASYFPARLHRSQALEPTRKYIFGYHPHGIISHGAFAAFGTEALGFSQLFPGITNTLLTLEANFRIPLYRDHALRMGLASVSRESCENILSRGGPNGEGMGRAITIVVGGARESLDAKPYTLRLVLKRRKGFVKLAIRTGADLVPVLAFGENDLYDQVEAGAHPLVHKMQLLVKRVMGFTVPLFHARGVFNYDVGLMPYRRPINIVVGKPILIQQAKQPDPAEVDRIHALYVAELVRIWDEWKDTFARHRVGELEIVE